MRGDDRRETLERLLREHAAPVYAVCLQVLRHRQDAEDAAQEALLKIARDLAAAASPAWVHQVAFRTALDVRRQRLRRRAREERAAGTARAIGTDADPALPVLQALAGLPDDDRAVLVEHFFARKTLRAIADARGCSEPAVWKRIEKGKDRLRQALLAATPAAVLALDGVLDAAEAAPAGLVERVLDAAPALAPSGWIAAAVGIPAVFVICVAAAAYGLRAEAPPPALAGATPVPSAPMPVASSAPSGPRRGEIAASPGVSLPAELPPYPYRLPPVHWLPARQEAWRILEEKKLDLSFQNAPLHELLQEVQRLSGMTILLDPALPPPPHPVTFKVKDLIVRNVLKLLLSQFQLDYVLRSDGTVWIGEPDRLPVEPDPRYEEALAARSGLDAALRELGSGKSGAETADPVRDGLQAPTRKIPTGTYSLFELTDLLREASGLNLHLTGRAADGASSAWQAERDLSVRLLELERAAPSETSRLERTALQTELRRIQKRGRSAEPVRKTFTGGTRTLSAHLDELASLWGVGWSVDTGILLIAGAEEAAESRSRSDGRRAAQLAAAARLDQPVRGAVPSIVPALADAFLDGTGLKLVPSAAAWESPVEASGATWREALASMQASGFRWILLEGKVYLDR